MPSYYREEAHQREHKECRRRHAGRGRGRRGLAGRRRRGRRRAGVASGRATGHGGGRRRRRGRGSRFAREDELGLGGEVAGGESVLVGGPGGDGGADLPYMVDGLHAAVQLQLAVEPDLAGAAGVGGEVGGRERDGRGGLAERHVAGDVVRPDGGRGGAGALERHERLRAGHALARGVERPGHPPVGPRRRGHERQREGRLGLVVGPVQRGPQLREVLALGVRLPRRELLGRARAGAGRGRRARGRHEEQEQQQRDVARHRGGHMPPLDSERQW